MAELTDAARNRLPISTQAVKGAPARYPASMRWRLARRPVGGCVLIWVPFLICLVTGRGDFPAPGIPLAAVCLCWAGFLTCHLLANGHWWAWLTVSLTPPLVFAVTPAALLLAVAAAGGPLVGAVSLLNVAAFAAGVPESGINFWAFLPRPQPSPGHSLSIVSWNTEYWHQYKDPEDFYRYLKGLDADLYLLQEYLYHVGNWRCRLLDDDSRLRAAFSGYEVLVKGQLVTISRLPVAAVPELLAPEIFRVDVRVSPGNGCLSTYNVHVPVQLGPFSPFRRLFHQVVKERAGERNQQIHELVDDLAGNAAPVVVAGDFNASPAVADVRRLGLVARDAVRASRRAYPASWNCRWGKLRLWRLDWAFTRGVQVGRYSLRDPAGRSDHAVQHLQVAVAPAGTAARGAS